MSPAASEPAPASPPALHGTWQMIRADLGGEPGHPLLVEHTVVEITATHYVVRYDREVADRGHLSIVVGDPHHRLILRGIEGPNAGRTIPAIFQRVGDLLRICYGLDGAEPAAFTSPPGSQLYLVTYRLKK